MYLRTYQITVWSLKRYTMAWCNEWIMGQLGQVGAGGQEVLIPVAQPEPHGNQMQSLILRSVNDLSDLEGAGERYIRQQFDFQFRVVAHYHPDADEEGNEILHPVIEAVNVGMAGDCENHRFSRPVQSMNLFSWTGRSLTAQETAKLVRTGGASVEQVADAPPKEPGASIRATLPSQNEAVQVMGHRQIADAHQADGFGIVRVSASVRSQGVSRIRADVRDGVAADADELSGLCVSVLDTGGKWKSFFRFVAVPASHPYYRLYVTGTGLGDAVLDMHDIDVRNLFSPVERIPRTEALHTSEYTDLVWRFLNKGATYLLLLMPVDVMGKTVVEVFRAADAEIAATFTVFEPSQQQSVVLPVVTADGTARMRLSPAAGGVTAFAWPYSASLCASEL